MSRRTSASDPASSTSGVRPLPRLAHPWLFAVYPVLFLFAANRDQLFVRDLALPMTVCLALVGLGFLVLRGWLGNGHRAALLTTIVWIALCSYGHVVTIIFQYRLWPPAWGVQRFVLALYALGLTAAIWRIARSRHVPTTATTILNTVGGTLIAVNLSILVAWQLAHRDGGHQQADHRAADTRNLDPDARRDIYYIVLDAFGRDDVLRDRFGLTGRTLTDRLEERGFFVARESVSNYASTFLSLTASLNMRYVTDMPPDESAWHMFNEQIEDNEVLRFLDAHGYTTAHFRSGKGITNDNPRADLRFRGGHLDELSTLLLESSLLAPALRGLLDSDRRATVLYALDRLPSIARMPEPTYTFAHILCPHPPFLFRADGTPQPQPVTDTRRAYLEQVTFISDRILGIVDQLLATEPEPIIVIQGDHGPSSSVDWNTSSPAWQPTPALVGERMVILNAVNLPERDAATVLGAELSPVNTFRLIFASYFGADLPRLPDRAFFSSYAYPYRFVDVSEQLQRPARAVDGEARLAEDHR